MFFIEEPKKIQKKSKLIELTNTSYCDIQLLPIEDNFSFDRNRPTPLYSIVVWDN